MNKENLDIIFFGDSLTFGYGVNKKYSWVTKLSNTLNYKFMNKGKNGDTTSSMLTRFYTDVLQYKPKEIFIMGGTNDLLCKRSISSIIENIEIMIKDGLTIGSEIIIGIPPILISDMANKLFSPSDFYIYAEIKLNKLKFELISLCNKYNIRYLNFYDLIPKNSVLFLDGLHLTEEGHDIMYKEALKIKTLANYI